MLEPKEKNINGMRFVNAKLAAEMLGLSLTKIYRLVSEEKKAAEKALRNHKHRDSTGIPFYQPGKNMEVFFPVEGLKEFVRRNTYGCAFEYPAKQSED